MRLFATAILGTLCLLAHGAFTAPTFEPVAGERILLLGDTNLERENTFGSLETRLHTAYPNVAFTVRNLSWSAELPTGWSRASFDKPEEGFKRLKDQIATVNPTVVILGFGMAASLQEVTDRSGDAFLNPDPARYGWEPMSATRFGSELAALVKAIQADRQVRFVFLAPLRHEDLRAKRPALPDSEQHNRLLAAYTVEIERLASTLNAPFVPAPTVGGFTENGIHLTEEGSVRYAAHVAATLGWPAGRSDIEPGLKQMIRRKNDLFFHQFRPANSTYLFGFRKEEQGQNASEMPKFTPLIEAADGQLNDVKRTGAFVPNAFSAVVAAKVTPRLSAPVFSTDADFEATLWADTSLVGKPVGMNWDPAGRLWVACSPVYPQIQPGAHPEDKVVVIEDSDRDGKADKSVLFASDLLIAAGVAPDFSAADEAAPTAAYVGASTELLHLRDTDGDGRADQRRIILSGFGTEDTHHTVHTLRWGSEGRLHFIQSIYVHSHVETPWGVVRANSSVFFAYDPRSERLEVLARGLINPWGRVSDRWGQAFATDGAGYAGLRWLVPGAMYQTYEGARRILPSISQGSYPKFASLEIVQSPLFPKEWQGNLVTGDFRAHRLARFQVNDLSLPATGTVPLSGYLTKELQTPLATTDTTFRPIDLRFGPDGALYIADWTNPIINHGEVDFRDPRRDHLNGRIWRFAPAKSKPLPWKPATQETSATLAGWINNYRAATDEPVNAWNVESARRVLIARSENAVRFLGPDASAERRMLEHEFALALGDTSVPPAKHDPSWDSRVLCGVIGLYAEREGRLLLAARSEGDRRAISSRAVAALAPHMNDPRPRVRLTATRALARFPSQESVGLVLQASRIQPGASEEADPFYSYAVWLSVNELREEVLTWIQRHTGENGDALIGHALSSLPLADSARVLQRLVAEKGVPTEGPWIELIGQIGSAPEVARVAESLASEKFADPAAITRAARSLIAAVARNIPISGDTKRVIARVRDVAPQEAVRLAGALRFPVLDFYAEQVQANPADAEAVFESMALARSPEIRAFLESILNVGTPKQPTGAAALALLKNPSASLRQRALVALATVDPDAALAALPGQLAVVPETELPALWRQLLKSTAFIKKLSTAIPAEMPKPAARAALRAAREIGKRGQPLITPFAALAGENPADAPADYTGLADYVRKNGNPAEGEIIYRRAALACTVCHAIGGAGGKVGPDMTTIGLSAPLDYLIESVLAPGAKVKEGYHAVVLNLAGGRTQSGVIVREDDKECLVRDAAGSEIAVPKASITSRENIGSIMPAGLTAGLNPREQAALFAFLSQLGKPGPFDASRANVARTWNLYPESALDELLASGTVTKPGQRALPLVSGNFPREQLSELLPFIPGQHKTVLATARFAVAQAGSIRFTLTGVTHAWLNGKALAIASDPRPVIELTPGTHTLAVQLPVDQLPDTLRAEAEGVRFLNE